MSREIRFSCYFWQFFWVLSILLSLSSLMISNLTFWYFSIRFLSLFLFLSLRTETSSIISLCCSTWWQLECPICICWIRILSWFWNLTYFCRLPMFQVTESVCCIQDDNVVTIPVVLALVPMMEFCHCTRISGTKFPSEYNVFCCLCLKQVNISFESSSSFSGGFCA